MTTAPRLLKFRPMQPGDIDLVLDWRAAPHIARWYGPAGDRARLELDLMERMESDWRFPHVVLLASRPVAYLEYYVAALAADRLGLADPVGWLGLDFFVGEVAALGKGIGTGLLGQALDLLFREDAIIGLVVDPAADNLVARRLFARAGFRAAGTGHLMTLDRRR